MAIASNAKKARTNDVFEYELNGHQFRGKIFTSIMPNSTLADAEAALRNVYGKQFKSVRAYQP